jgi:hypothetical protein
VSGFRYRIDKVYLLTHIQPTHPPTQENRQQSTRQPSQKPVHQTSQEQKSIDISVLKAKEETIIKQDETIAILKEQLKQKDEQIKEMLKRDGERNILFHKFQDALMLEAPKKSDASTDIPIQEAAHQPIHQTAQQDIQPIQTEKEVMDKKPNQKETTGKRKVVKPTSSKSQKIKIDKLEQPKRKSFFSFLSRK